MSDSHDEFFRVWSEACPGTSFSLPQHETIHLRMSRQGRTHAVDMKIPVQDQFAKMQETVAILSNRLVLCRNCQESSCSSEFQYLCACIERAIGNRCMMRLLSLLMDCSKEHPEWFPEENHIALHELRF